MYDCMNKKLIQHRVKANEELELILEGDSESVKVAVEAGGRLKLWIWCDAVDNVERDVEVELQGASSEAYTHLVFLGRGETRHQFQLRHRHTGEYSLSQMHVVGAVTDSSRVRADAVISLEAGSRGARGHLQEHQLILSETAGIEAIPSLEIRHHEVQASHSATVERVPGELLFYLRSRGLAEDVAQRLIVEGFFQEALRHAPAGWPAEKKFKELLKML